MVSPSVVKDQWMEKKKNQLKEIHKRHYFWMSTYLEKMKVKIKSKHRSIIYINIKSLDGTTNGKSDSELS